jgi:hypothetical protein
VEKKPGRKPTEVPLGLVAAHKEGHSNRQMAQMFGVNHKTVAVWLNRLGLSSNRGNDQIDFVDETQARCIRCGKIRAKIEFQRGRRGKHMSTEFLLVMNVVEKSNICGSMRALKNF